MAAEATAGRFRAASAHVRHHVGAGVARRG